MGKQKQRAAADSLFDTLQQRSLTGPTRPGFNPASGTAVGNELRMMKKFRFQLLHRWLVAQFAPCRVADIAGGKGLLAYLLQRSGWDAVVVDPVPQSLPAKFKDFATGRSQKIRTQERVPHLDVPFTTPLGAHFDLLVGLHAHGANAAVIDAAARFNCGYVLLPCCIVDEPFYPVIGIDWLESVADYALRQGRSAIPFQLNFKGQHIGLYDPGRCAPASGA
jgi:hypothetical protein